MEYYRTDDGQIQADLARRLGIVLEQYHREIRSHEKYELSLCLSILQMLSTNTMELLKKLKGSEKKLNPFYNTPIDRAIWGFDENSIKFTSFYEPNLNAEKVLRHIRNALSHPTKIDLSSSNKTTGYTTRGNTNNNIESVLFISSPDLNARGNPRTFKSKTKAEEHFKEQGNFPKDILIAQLSDGGEFGFWRNEEPFYRIFEIELDTISLLSLTYSLTCYLAHPLIEKWDGKTFNINTIAA